MAKDVATGVVLTDRELSWTSVRRTKSGVERLETETVPLPGPSGKEPAEGAGEERLVVLKGVKARIRSGSAFVLPSTKVLLRSVRLPAVPDDELAGMVQLQLDKFSPFPVENLVFSHEVLRRDENELRVLIAAIERRAMESFTAEIEAAGLRPRRLDVCAMIRSRILKDAGEIPDEGRHPVVVITPEETEIIVFEDGAPVLFRALGGSMQGGDEELAAEVAREVEYSLMTMELECGPALLKTVGLWYSSESAYLKDRIAEALPVSVESGALDSLPPVSEGAAARMFDAGAVNLVPAVWRSAGMARQFKKRMLTAAAVLLSVWVIMVGAGAGTMLYRRSGIDRLSSEAESLVAPAMQVRDLRRRVVLVKRYTDKRDSALEYLREISAILPEGIDLSSFSYRKGEGVKISGAANAVDLVYRFKNAIDGSEMFKEAALTGPRKTPKGEEVFSIEIMLREGESEQ